jgi:NAD(P)-dependent dehydrogenase (short-subunit alcohol dehydrogenase family)
MEENKNVLSLFKLDGEKAIVTGAGRGFGREISLGLAEAGADVAVVDMLQDECRETAEMVRKLGRKAIALQCDITKEEDVSKMVGKVIAEFGRIDTLVCNAGICSWVAAEEMEFSTWQKLMDVNLNGVFLCCNWAGKEMIKQKKGSIINIASMSAYIVNYPQKQSHYNTSKAGVVHLTKSLAVEWAPYNVRVNVLCPGYIMTPLLKLADPEILKQWVDMTVQKRIPDPSELKGIIVFLASQAASYFTGSSIIADGGYSLW